MSKEELEIELSKTQKKKRALEVLSFTKKVSSFSIKQIEKLDIPDEIKNELYKLQKMKSYSARGRHIKYIAGLFRGQDDFDKIKEKIEKASY